VSSHSQALGAHHLQLLRLFDYIENIMENRVQMGMADIATSVDKFLSFNEYEVLAHKGRISKSKADQKALAENAQFNRTQKN
jgi:hypothetical protein